VSRILPNCDFSACPTFTTISTSSVTGTALSNVTSTQLTITKSISQTMAQNQKAATTKVPTVKLLVNNSNGPITNSYNTSATLSWVSTNTTSCIASDGWSGTKSVSGSESTGNLISSKTYTITCTGYGSSVVGTVKVNVLALTPAPTLKYVAQTSYTMNVLVLKYFPLTADGQNIDINVTGDVGDSYATIYQRTVDVTNNLVTDLERATQYMGYANLSVSPSLRYSIVDTKEYNKAVPFDPATRKPLYNQILSDNNICDYVNNKGVKEVWFWAYQGPSSINGMPYLNISESKMSGPFGDISNSYRLNDMPQCGKTYRVYTFNYGRGTSEAVESWGHQIEAEVDAINSTLFRNIFQGPNYPQTLGVTGRCGSVHNPPNARSEYDRNNPTPQKSDCLDWNPSGIGTLSYISCQNWGCADVSDSNNSSLNYMIWNWQNLPGLNNVKKYQGKNLRNFWDIHGDFDNVMKNDKTVFLGV